MVLESIRNVEVFSTGEGVKMNHSEKNIKRGSFFSEMDRQISSLPQRKETRADILQQQAQKDKVQLQTAEEKIIEGVRFIKNFFEYSKKNELGRSLPEGWSYFTENVTRRFQKKKGKQEVRGSISITGSGNHFSIETRTAVGKSIGNDLVFPNEYSSGWRVGHYRINLLQKFPLTRPNEQVISDEELATYIQELRQPLEALIAENDNQG
jgi:hypothetical protein